MTKPHKPSKKRAFKSIDKLTLGNKLTPSAALREKYYKQLRDLFARLTATYTQQLEIPGQQWEKNQFLLAQYQRVLSQLRFMVAPVFDAEAARIAGQFVNEVSKYSAATVSGSLAKMGVEMGIGAMGPMPDLMVEHITNNVALITKLRDEAQSEIEQAVMRSFTSDNPDEQGAYGISKALQETHGMTRERADLIATDQTAKVYADINAERMIDAGVSTFVWRHSSAGKVPRESHIELSGRVFLNRGGPAELWELLPDGSIVDANPSLPKGDRGKPGYAINCRCRMQPAIKLTD